MRKAKTKAKNSDEKQKVKRENLTKSKKQM